MTVPPDVIAIIAEILTEHGPLHQNDIEQHARDRGFRDLDLQWNMLDMDCPARQLADERWIWLPAVFTGRVFTHRVNGNESAHDLLNVTPDLDPLTTLCENADYQVLTDGSAVHPVVLGFDDELLDERNIPDVVIDEEGALLLERGALARLGIGDGDLLGLRLTADGLVLERVDDVIADHAVGEQLAAVLTDGPMLGNAAIWTMCVADTRLFTDPLPPLSEIVDEFGLARSGEWLAPRGFDFGTWRFEARCELLGNRHGLDDHDAFVLASLVDLYDQALHLLQSMDGPGDDTEMRLSLSGALMGKLGQQLYDPVLAESLVAETVDVDPSGAPALGMLAETMEAEVPKSARAACRWLQAVALERSGLIAEAEHELLAAESMDPDWPPTLLDLARFASDRGDAERGLGLLRRAGLGPDHPLVSLLQAHRVEPRRDLGRNEPCWCGSGNKYKKCHLGREELTLPERVKWLCAKAAQYVEFSQWRELLVEVGFERYRDTYDIDEALDAGLADTLAMDVVLFEGGAFADFLRVRGSLLPDDERTLAEQWLTGDRSVFEVQEVDRGEGVTVRDLRSGDEHAVRERMGSCHLKVGQLICARVASGGDSMQLFALETVAIHDRDDLLEVLDGEPDPVDLIAALSRPLAD